jgi:cytochrome b involved in lipid metabolism
MLAILWVLLALTAKAEKVTQYINHAITLSWEFTEWDSIILTITCRSRCYCAIGFGEDMYDVDMVWAYKNETANFATIFDTWSTGHVAPVFDNPSNPNGSFGNVTFALNKDSFEVSGERPLNSNDKLDKKLYPGIKTDFIWAWFDSFRYHFDNYGTGELTMGLTYGDFDKENVYSHDYKLHGIAMSLCWGVFGTIAIVLARYFKQYWIWFWGHLLFGGMIVIVTIYSCIEIYDDNRGMYEYWTDVKRKHSRIGMLVMVTVGVQGLLGLISAFLIWKRKHIHQISVMRTAHKILGYALTIIGLWNLWTGWEMYDDDWHGLMTALYTIIGVTYFLLEIRHQVAIHFPAIKYLDCRRANLPEMTHQAALNKVFREGKKWVFYDDLVLDVAPFVNSHPGGAIFIKKAYGEDMGKYINGCSSFGEHYLPYDHTNQARDLAERLAIAKIPYPEEVFIKKSKQIDFGNMEWTVASKRFIATNTLYVKLASFALGILNDGVCPTHFGKHFLITSDIDGRTVRRYYSALFVNLEEWSKQVLGTTMKINSDSLEDSYVEDEDNHKLTSFIQLIIKVYYQGAFTSYLNHSPLGLNLTLKGPIGPGLALNPDCRGKYMALAGGTGLVPILDLAHLIWDHHRSGSSNDGQTSLFIYASFRSYRDGIAVELLRSCAEQCPNIKVHFCFSDGEHSQEKLSRDLLIRNDVKDMDRVWVCGPSGFNRWAYKLLRKEKVMKEKIMIL